MNSILHHYSSSCCGLFRDKFATAALSKQQQNDENCYRDTTLPPSRQPPCDARLFQDVGAGRPPPPPSRSAGRRVPPPSSRVLSLRPLQQLSSTSPVTPTRVLFTENKRQLQQQIISRRNNARRSRYVHINTYKKKM